MSIVKLSKTQFDEFASKHECASFYQTTNWGDLKASTGWKSHLLGYYENDILVAAGLFLAK